MGSVLSRRGALATMLVGDDKCLRHELLALRLQKLTFVVSPNWTRWTHRR